MGGDGRLLGSLRIGGRLGLVLRLVLSWWAGLGFATHLAFPGMAETASRIQGRQFHGLGQPEGESGQGSQQDQGEKGAGKTLHGR